MGDSIPCPVEWDSTSTRSYPFVARGGRFSLA